MTCHRRFALLAACVLMFSICIGCSGERIFQSGSDVPGPEDGQLPLSDTYTLNECITSLPTTLNPHTRRYDVDEYVPQYTEMPLVDVSIAADGVNFVWLYEMADDISDITASFEQRGKYEITEDSGRVYKITLNPLACWEDGTPINAHTYVYSMQQLLSPEADNYRSDNYYHGDIAIYNAEKYYNSGSAGEVKYSPLVTGWLRTEPYPGDSSGDVNGQSLCPSYTAGDTVYLNVDRCSPFFGEDSCFADYINSYHDTYPEFEPFAEYVGTGEYIPVTDLLREQLCAVAEFLGDTNPAAWREFCFCEDGVHLPVSWDDVGLYAADDYTLIYVTQSPVSMFYFLAGMTGNWIVYQPLYEAGKTNADGYTVTDYGSSADTYMSYGPYKLVSADREKLIFARNEQWYGYGDGRHVGQYQTTDIRCDVISDHDAVLELFDKGALDCIKLGGDDLSALPPDAGLHKTPETYMYRYVFATDPECLAALEQEAADGSNKRVLAYDDFRRAISLSIDRSIFCANGSAGFKPGYYLLNGLYYYDIENDINSIYRNSDAAKRAMCRLYGVEYGDGCAWPDLDSACASITGYDPERARSLFQSVYEQATADGQYTDGQQISINCVCSAYSELSDDDLARQELLNRFAAEASAGTGFEGKIHFTFTCGDFDRYLAVANGEVEMICSAWGSAPLHPFSMIRVYCSPMYMGSLSKIHESNGWNPALESLEITADFDGDGEPESEVRSFESWSESINDPAQFAGRTQLCTEILAGLEAGVLDSCQCIPWGASAECSMYSDQICYATDEYNIVYEYGGIRLLTYNYTDSEWEAINQEKQMSEDE